MPLYESGHLPMTPGQQGGLFGELISLGGVVGRPNLGRVLSSASVTAGTIAGLAVSNPQRICAIIQNKDDAAAVGSIVLVYLGGSATVPIALTAYGSLQIDSAFPWTGDIWVSAPSGSPVCVINEVSVP